MQIKKWLLFPFLFVCFFISAQVPSFDIVRAQNKATIVYAKEGVHLDSICAQLLANDIEKVTGYKPKVLGDISKATGNIILIGTINAPLIKAFLPASKLAAIQGKWECYAMTTIPSRQYGINNILVIAGSDPRGTAYGVFDISERIGVSAWNWWADVTPQKRSNISLAIKDTISSTPSVQYRGIFINDEDWGLQPWAAKKYDTITKDIGPKTYAQVFELLLRLKANLIWPAMHPSTKAFFSIPGNTQVAKDFEMIVGSSHAEPMLRNNVGEWNEKTMGAFNYITNKHKVQNYWDTRIQQSSEINALYSMGMRGVHDSGIEGVKNNKEAVPLLESIFKDQRSMLSKYLQQDASQIPQVFTAYKEVLDIYDAGLIVPDDITLVWPDDNYGYIQRLNNNEEIKRKGGAGVYYHTSYWGRPHDYLWINSSSPILMQEEMSKAYQMGAAKLWVLNVGDIKPAEYNIQCFLDMAYNIKPFLNQGYYKTHLKNWYATNVSTQFSNIISETYWKYYQLAFERKPEFMGWSQTEPTTKVNTTAYNHSFYGDQAQQRIDSYNQLQQTIEALQAKTPASRQAAYTELVAYPISGAAWMNKKYLYRDKAILYASQGRIIANTYAEFSLNAHKKIKEITEHYNQAANGKWKYIMSMSPRNLPVFDSPTFNINIAPSEDIWNVMVEGESQQSTKTESELKPTHCPLPSFQVNLAQKYFIDIFLTQSKTANLQIRSSANWIQVSKSNCTLLPQGIATQQRIWVNIDWAKAPSNQKLEGFIQIKDANKTIQIPVMVNPSSSYISIFAKNFQRQLNKGTFYWEKVNATGITESDMEAMPLSTDLLKDSIRQMPTLEYDFNVSNSLKAKLHTYCLPTHALNKKWGLRFTVQVDESPIEIVNIETVGRSETWKQNVLSNVAENVIELPILNAGKHTLKIGMIDPGVILDRFLIDLGGFQPGYGTIPENRQTDSLNLIKNIQTTTLFKGRDTGNTWFLPRVCPIPNGQGTHTLMTLQTIAGSDYYGPVHFIESVDNGNTWSLPQAIPGLGRQKTTNDIEEAVSDVIPQYHPQTKKILAIGEILYYSKGKFFKDQPPRYPIYITRDSNGKWSERKKLEWNDPRNTSIYGAGSSQFVILPNGDVIIPIMFRAIGKKEASVTTLLCSFDGNMLKVKKVGNELKNNSNRGLLEHQLIKYNNIYYLSIRAEDAHGYVCTSKDGLNWSAPKAWTWDSGDSLSMSSTQQHWMAHSNGLYLVYTRKATHNRNVMRWRAPLFLAKVDPVHLQLIQSTEQTVFPMIGDGINNPTYVPQYGNFHVNEINENESWITSGEVIQANFKGDLLMAKVKWKQLNKRMSIKK